MKGIIFNITEDFISEHFGDEILEEIISDCSLETKEPFVAPGTYSDLDLLEIITKSCQHLNLTISEFLKDLGKYTFGKLAARHPNFVTPHKHPKDFLKTVEDVIHMEVRKLYKDTHLPSLKYVDPGPDELIITYYSKRKLYALMEGLIEGVAQYFKVPIVQSHTITERNGEECCDFHLRFDK